MAARRLNGFTLIEVMIALVILAIAMASVQALFTDQLVGRIGTEDRRARAIQIAAERVQALQADPSYASLQSRYAGTESSIAGYPGFTRTTTVTWSYNVATRTDYKTFTVTVTHPSLSPAVARTLVIAAP
jgi:prepilin-type N-terminal cleavage/methylation domain-containing protein